MALSNFMAMPRIAYGIQCKAAYYRMRDTSGLSVSISHIYMDYVLLSMETYMTQKININNKLSTLHRKAYIYHALSKAMSSPTARHGEETLIAICATVVAEARLRNSEPGRKHCVGLLHLINARGGRRDAVRLLCRDYITGQHTCAHLFCECGRW
jgi:hypothetical protein